MDGDNDTPSVEMPQDDIFHPAERTKVDDPCIPWRGEEVRSSWVQSITSSTNRGTGSQSFSPCRSTNSCWKTFTTSRWRRSGATSRPWGSAIRAVMVGHATRTAEQSENDIPCNRRNHPHNSLRSHRNTFNSADDDSSHDPGCHHR